MKDFLKNPKVLALVPVATALLGYFGYTPIQELTAPPSVDIDVHVPEQDQHTHPTHSHKNWEPEIDNSLQKHIEEYH